MSVFGMNESLGNEIAKSISDLEKENQELKKQLENTDYTSVYLKACEDTKDKYESQQKEFIEYLEDEKNRLAKECSNTYEDSLGRLLYVNEDIFNEVNRILLKYKEIIGGDNK